MKLIREEAIAYDVVMQEDAQGGKKNLFIEGIFMQANIKNRNGRIYPRPVMEKALKNYNENYTSKGRALGELGHPCFWGKTDVLTETGIKNIKDIHVGEMVPTLNPKTDTVMSVPVLEVHKNKFKGKMIAFDGRSISTKVTPYHRFYCIHSRTGEGRFFTAQEILEGMKEKSLRKWFIPISSLGSENTFEEESYEISPVDLKKNGNRKEIPKSFLEGMSQQEAETLLEWFIIGDGRGSVLSEPKSASFFTTSKSLIDSLSYISVLCGYSFTKSTVVTECDYMFAGRNIEAKNKSPLYQAKVRFSRGTYLDDRFLSVEWDVEDYDDYVYCITTENSTFYAVEDGRCFLTGNCGPSINLDRVSHLITDLRMEGDNVMGKAKIVDTAMGNIARGLIESGVSLGVSSRGLGSIKESNGASVVQADFRIATGADIVADPSGPECWVNGLMEGVEWVWNNGVLVEKNLQDIKKKVKTKKINEEVAFDEFRALLSKIKKT